MLTKSQSCNEIQKRSHLNTASTAIIGATNGSNKSDHSRNEQHKTVIYFGDSIASRKHHSRPMISSSSSNSNVNQKVTDLLRNVSNKSEDFQHARRLCDEMIFKRQHSIRLPKTRTNGVRDGKCGSSNEHIANGSKTSLSSFESDQNLMIKELKSVVEVKLKNQLQQNQSTKPVIALEKPIVPQKIVPLPQRKATNAANGVNVQSNVKDVCSLVDSNSKADGDMPSFVDSVANGVINIKIDGSFDMASKLAESLGHDDGSESEFGENGSDTFLDLCGDANSVHFDWSFVQDWRAAG